MTFQTVRDNPDDPRVVEAVEFVERNFPSTAEGFRHLSDLLYRFFCVKQKDYGPENIRKGRDLSTEQGRTLSIRAVGERTDDKVSRIDNLTLKRIETEPLLEAMDAIREMGQDEAMRVLKEMIDSRKAANEPLLDAFVDTAIYGIIMILVDDDNWGK